MVIKKKATELLDELRKELKEGRAVEFIPGTPVAQYDELLRRVWHLTNSDTFMSSFQKLTLHETIRDIQFANNPLAAVIIATYINSCNGSGI